ncbi:MAG: hypothetical protein ABI595_09430, partial [Actinomycetota bacterium]
GNEAALDFDDVTSFSEQTLGHRFMVTLEHEPLSRPHHVPAHRFLMFEWGNAVSSDPLSRTKLAFSRRDTKAAVALREQLTSRRMRTP